MSKINPKFRKDQKLTIPDIDRLGKIYQNKGWNEAKWMVFCRQCLAMDLQVERKPAKTTESNYIYVYGYGKCFKVRFSTHKANYHQEKNGDSDCYVGKTLNGYRSTEYALAKVKKYFGVT